MNFDFNNIDTLIEIAIASFSLYQNANLHKAKKQVDSKLHEKELDEDYKEFQHEDIHERRTHLLIVLNELERHFQQLNSDLISQSRESERDSWDQRSQVRHLSLYLSLPV
jgi:hypothetical protein